MGSNRRLAWWRAFVSLAGIAIGVVYLSAALIKGADPSLFIEQVRGYKMLPESLAPAAAYALLIAEGVLGIGLLFRVWPRTFLLIGGLLMLTFIAGTGWAWAHGNASSCGCFGRLASRGPGAVILEDSLFLMLIAFSFVFSGNAAGGLRWGFWSLLPLVLLFPWIGPRLPVDGWVTSIHRGTDFSDLAADDLKVPLDQGDVLVAMVGPACPACDAALPQLERLVEGPVPLTAIFAGDRREKFEWRNEHVPPFPVAHAPAKALRQYYRRLPAFFLLRDGKVQKIWWSRAPRPEEVRF